MAKSVTYTVYSAFGHTVFTAQMCGTELDTKSRRNLNDIEALLVPSADSFAEPPTDDHFAQPPR